MRARGQRRVPRGQRGWCELRLTGLGGNSIRLSLVRRLSRPWLRRDIMQRWLGCWVNLGRLWPLDRRGRVFLAYVTLISLNRPSWIWMLGYRTRIWLELVWLSQLWLLIRRRSRLRRLRGARDGLPCRCGSRRRP